MAQPSDILTPDGAPEELDALFERALAGELKPAEAEILARAGFSTERIAEIKAGFPPAIVSARALGEWIGCVHTRIADLEGRPRRDVGQSPSSDISASQAVSEKPTSRKVGRTRRTAYAKQEVIAGITLRGGSVFGTRFRRIGLAVVVGGVAICSLWFARMHSSVLTRVYQTASGQQSVIRLADGSVIQLAPMTTATVAYHTIDLDGEALFTIGPRATRPVIVRTRNAIVRVLGTQFLVRQYPNEVLSRIVVEKGRVTVASRHAFRVSHLSAVVSAKMVAQVDDSGNTVTQVMTAGDVAALTHGRLVFDGAPVRDIAIELSRQYGVNVRVTDSVLANRRMTMRVSVAEQPLSQVLGIICEIQAAHIAQVGDAWMLMPGPDARQTFRRTPFPQPEQQYGK